MRVMGVDPGLTRCGMSLVDGGTGRAVTALDVDVVRTSSDMDLALRLVRIADAAEHWMDTHHPDVVAVERVFSQQNVRTAMGTAQAGGVVALAAARRGISVSFHTPSEVKAAVTGNGSADKAQVTAMITRVLGLQKAPTPADAADALALAVCHCWRAPMMARMAEAERRVKEQEKAFRARIARERRARGGGTGMGTATGMGRRTSMGTGTSVGAGSSAAANTAATKHPRAADKGRAGGTGRASLKSGSSGTAGDEATGERTGRAR